MTKRYNVVNLERLVKYLKKREVECDNERVIKWLEIMPEKYRKVLLVRWGLSKGEKYIPSFVQLDKKMGINNSEKEHMLAIQYLQDARFVRLVKDYEKKEWKMAANYGSLLSAIFNSDDQHSAERIEEVMKTLTEREEKVIIMRFGINGAKRASLEEVAKEFNVTRERIRQIEAKALRKLRHPARKIYFQ